jgi:tRNA (uracil-5-)-methyltransferase TRM9
MLCVGSDSGIAPDTPAAHRTARSKPACRPPANGPIVTDVPDGPDGIPSTAAHTRQSVRETYDEIAVHFAKTRAYPWPETEDFLAEVGPARRGLDVGCGNGRNTELLADAVDHATGVDSSRGLLETAEDRAAERAWTASFCQADAARLPIAADTIDVAIYVATIHHLPDRETRVASLDELARVLAPGGTALVSAWATVHDRFDVDPDADTGFDTTVDWTLPGGETVPRYYHIYAPAEFDADLARSDLAVAETYLSSGNCYARVSPEG